jgi:hypothetical protein
MYPQCYIAVIFNQHSIQFISVQIPKYPRIQTDVYIYKESDINAALIWHQQRGFSGTVCICGVYMVAASSYKCKCKFMRLPFTPTTGDTLSMAAKMPSLHTIVQFHRSEEDTDL